jgi:hypothetical protein
MQLIAIPAVRKRQSDGRRHFYQGGQSFVDVAGLMHKDAFCKMTFHFALFNSWALR